MASNPATTRIPGGIKSSAKFKIELGLVTLEVTGYNVGKSSRSTDTGASYACPHDNGPVEQFYACKVNPEHTNMKAGDLGRAAFNGSTAVALSAEDLEAAKDDAIPEKVFSISVHPANEVEAATTVVGTVWTLYPVGPKDSGVSLANPTYTVIHGAIQRAEAAGNVCVGLLKTGRGGTKLYRLSTRGSHLTLASMLFPQDLNETLEMEHVEVPEAHISMADTLLAGLVMPFDPASYKTDVRERIAAIVEQKGEGAEIITLPTPAPAAAGVDPLMAALEASLAAQSKTKAKPKKAAAAKNKRAS